ncbi:uncharacterized protein H6S33_007495 [Morchella sextelata]|uniref:uncharacterized protein n=1 Tax=Morchella sextelata TaxID=1174677 RepID=UPI001D03A747|nr:uncharacterized protein H6S33_007495 [Morchella sextelata]KAH0603836.1 hypothetical protein H6S33_007495 [Morchella sextelata]
MVVTQSSRAFACWAPEQYLSYLWERSLDIVSICLLGSGTASLPLVGGKAQKRSLDIAPEQYLSTILPAVSSRQGPTLSGAWGVLSHGLPGTKENYYYIRSRYNTWHLGGSLPRPTGGQKGPYATSGVGIIPGIERRFSPTAYRGQKKTPAASGPGTKPGTEMVLSHGLPGAKRGLMPHPGQVQHPQLRFDLLSLPSYSHLNRY